MARPGPSFYILMLFILIATTLMHELVHWSVGEVLGYDMYFTLTTSGIIEGQWRSELDYAIVSIVGPIFTLCMGILGAWFAIVKKIQFGYELIFVASCSGSWRWS